MNGGGSNIVIPRDPNDKIAPAGHGEAGYVQADGRLSYQIRFENISDATAPAQDDPTRVDPGEFFFKNWLQRYKKELAYTSDKRYHYLGSGKCYYQMGEAMGKAMVEHP